MARSTARFAAIVAVLTTLTLVAPAAHASSPPQFRADATLPGSDGAEPSH